MTEFMIMGERNSGTHFLQHAITENFGKKYRFNHLKHFWYDQKLPSDIPTIMIVRHPIDWIDSMWKRKHHVPPKNRQSIYSYIRNEWYSEERGVEIMGDRHLQTGRRYRDIFEMRQNKIDFLLNRLNDHNNMLIRYEDLRDDYEKTLQRIADFFGWSFLYRDIKPIRKYKGTYNELYKKKDIELKDDVIQEIKRKVDVDQELRIGYLILF